MRGQTADYQEFETSGQVLEVRSRVAGQLCDAYGYDLTLPQVDGPALADNIYRLEKYDRRLFTPADAKQQLETEREVRYASICIATVTGRHEPDEPEQKELIKAIVTEGVAREDDSAEAATTTIPFGLTHLPNALIGVNIGDAHPKTIESIQRRWVEYGHKLLGLAQLLKTLTHVEETVPLGPNMSAFVVGRVSRLR